MTIVITAVSHPHLRQAFEDLECDGGRHLIGTVYPGPAPDFSSYEVPPPWSRYVDAAERGLARLRECGEDDWDTFISGEQDDMAALVERQGDLAEASMLLNALFDDWPVDDVHQEVLS